MPDTRRILLCGAQSTGKTTLLNDVIGYLHIHNEAEVARSIMVERKWSNSDIDPVTKPQVFEELQFEILRRQKQIDEKHKENCTDYISDRSLDPIVYTEVYLSVKARDRVVKSNLGKYCIDRVKHSLVFVITPHPEIAKSDGVRMEPDLPILHKFTDVMINTLQKHDIPHHVISVLDRKERVQQVLSIIHDTYPNMVKPQEY